MSYARAMQLMATLEDHGIRAVADPRSAVPPCVLLQPPRRVYDLPGLAYTATWRLVCLAPGPGTADAWVALDGLVAQVLEVLDPDLADASVEPGAYALPGAEPLPSMTVILQEGITP